MLPSGLKIWFIFESANSHVKSQTSVQNFTTELRTKAPPMKNTITILIAILLFSACRAQNEGIVFHPIVLKAKETSLYSEQVDWKKVNDEFIALTKGEGKHSRFKKRITIFNK